MTARGYTAEPNPARVTRTAAACLGVLFLLVSVPSAMATVKSRSIQGVDAPAPPELAIAPPKMPLPGISSKGPRDGGLNRRMIIPAPAQAPSAAPRRAPPPAGPAAAAKPARPGFEKLAPSQPAPMAIVEDLKAIVVEPKQITPGGELVPADERVEVPDSDRSELPFSAIGRLSVRFANGIVGSGTGFMAAKGMVLTAAHVLHDPRYGPAIGVRFTSACRQGLSGGDPDYSQDIDSSAVRVAARWTTSQYSINHDFGALILPDADWHDRCGTLPVHPVDTAFVRRHTDRAGSQFIVSGYPAEKANASMWMGRGSLAPSLPLQLNHRVDTTEGQSGAPVIAILKDSSSGQKVARVVAIHSRALIYLLSYNIARPIEPRLVEEIAGWR